MKQKQLFNPDDNIHKALAMDVDALGGAAQAAVLLWPAEAEADIHRAQRKVSDCLNPGNRQKFSLDEFLFIQREAKKRNSFNSLYFQCHDIGMTKPQPIEPEDEFARLQREFIEAQRAMGNMIEQMEKLSAPNTDSSYVDINSHRLGRG